MEMTQSAEEVQSANVATAYKVKNDLPKIT